MPVSGGISGNIDTVQLSHLLGTDIVTATSTSLVLSGGGVSLKLTGFGLTYDSNEQLVGGTVTNIEFADPEPVSAFGRVLGHIDGITVLSQTSGDHICHPRVIFDKQDSHWSSGLSRRVSRSANC